MSSAKESIGEAGIVAIAAVEVVERDQDEVQDLVQVFWALT